MFHILVFMSDNRKLEHKLKNANYNSLVASINYEYCKRNNYDFLYYRPYLLNKDKTELFNCKNPKTNNLRHAAWSKLLSTTLALHLNYDYVCYIDSDCIFKDFNQTIQEFIKPYSDKDIIFLNDKPYSYTKPCSGFYICKVNNHAKNFLEDWYNVNITRRDKNHPWEQAALYTIYRKYNVGIIDSWMFKEKQDQFLRHIGTADNKIRMPYFLNFIKTKNIDYEQNINNIQVLDFDTYTHNIDVVEFDTYTHNIKIAILIISILCFFILIWIMINIRKKNQTN